MSNVTDEISPGLGLDIASYAWITLYVALTTLALVVNWRRSAPRGEKLAWLLVTILIPLVGAVTLLVYFVIRSRRDLGE
ncbi:hypothetical protein C5C86_14475 [Rathayibacter sp. AY1E4]|uniref:PLDc N-terminal domain-containing protein n=1 Tax=Rathayibacter sp. AY1E4 TaxID=2080552 RepID=UPI000CE86248|nr:hypothetical protein C5C86_14475 [Rathayibacter sp. AY1E4]